jgi:hypothetical protein
LEKVKADTKFLVFGNEREVPEQWLRRYGHLIIEIKFYFLGSSGDPERLNDTELTAP